MFVTTYRRGVFVSEMLTRCEQVMAQVCADFGATLAEFNGEEDHVHLLVQYPPKVAPSHLVNPLKGVSSRRLRQDFAEAPNKAAWGYPSNRPIAGQLCARGDLLGVVPGWVASRGRSAASAASCPGAW